MTTTTHPHADLAHRLLRFARRHWQAVTCPICRFLYSHFTGLRARYWERRAADIDRQWGHGQGDFATLGRIIREIGAHSVLDFGAGSGRLVPLFDHYDIARAVLQDVSYKALQLCREHYPHGRMFLTQNPLSLLIEDGHRFDLSISNYTLMCLAPDEAAKAIANLCAMSRYVYINETNQNTEAGHFFYLSAHPYEELFAACGFAPVQTGTIEGDRWTLFSRRDSK